MAEEVRNENLANNYSFEKNPLEYCKALYTEFDTHNQEIVTQVKENKEFYQGICKELDKRKNSKNVKRSAVFIHEARPSIDTGKSAIIDALEEGLNDAIQQIPQEGAEDQKDQVDTQSVKLNERLRDDGFLTSKFKEWLDLSRVAPVSFCFAGWNTEYGIKYEIDRGPVEMTRKVFEWMRFKLGMQSHPPEDRVVETWDIIDEGPYSEILDFDELLYDPRTHGFQDSRAVIRRARMDWNELVNHAREGDWDMDEVKRMKRGREALLKEGVNSSSLADDEREALNNGSSSSYDDGKFTICEFWIPVWDDEGRKKIRKYYLGENYYALSRDHLGMATQWNKFPFVPFACHKLVNQIEGVPHVRLSMPLQREYNDLWNAANDVLTYNTFKRIILGNGVEFREQPKVSPQAFWKINGDINQVKEMDSGLANLPALLPLIQAVSQKINQLHNSPDFAQGKEMGGNDEKVFQTRLRAAGSSRRSRTEFKEAGQAIIGVGQLFIDLYRQHLQPEWVYDAKMDVPSLTGNYTPQEEQDKMLSVVSMATSWPVFQSPMGLLKYRNLVEKLFTKLRLRDIDDILPTVEEMQVENQVLGMISKLTEENETNTQPGTQEVQGDDGQQTQGAM